MLRNVFVVFGTERNTFYGTDFVFERNGTDFTERIHFWNGTEQILRNVFFVGTERNGTERFIPQKVIEKVRKT